MAFERRQYTQTCSQAGNKGSILEYPVFKHRFHFICLCVKYVCRGVHVKLRDNLMESALSFHHLGTGGQMQVIILEAEPSYWPLEC